MNWYCVRCATEGHRLVDTISDRYRDGYCLGCRKRQLFVERRASGADLKAEGMARVSAASDPEWVRKADEAIRVLAARGEPFSAEDVAKIAGRPERPNAMGARISAAARRGIIAKAGVVQAERVERHSNEMRSWKGAVAR